MVATLRTYTAGKLDVLAGDLKLNPRTKTAARNTELPGFVHLLMRLRRDRSNTVRSCNISRRSSFIYFLYHVSATVLREDIVGGPVYHGISSTGPPIL